jgi:hypothetical protein
MNIFNQTIIALLIAFIGSTALASSHRRFFYGDEAAMTAGAGTALARDTGAVYYNPAGLGGNSHRKLQVSGTAYGLAIRHLDGILNTRINGNAVTTDTTIHHVGVVPSAFAIVFQLSNRVTAGLGIYQTENNAIHLRVVQQRQPVGAASQWNAGVEYHEQLVQYTAGPALGIQITEHLKWGIANFGVFHSQDASLRFHMGFNRADALESSDDFSLNSQFAQIRLLGTLITTGFQWQLNDSWHTGLMFRSPTVLLWQKQDASLYDAGAITTSSGTDSSSLALFNYRELDNNDVDFSVVIPPEIQFSIAYTMGKNWVGADAAYQFSLKKENHRGVFNASIGGFMNISPKLDVGIGVFTDNDSQRDFDGKLTLPRRRFGATAGFQFRLVELVERLTSSSTTDDQQRRRILLTTLAFSYSMQFARFQTFNFNADTATERFDASLEQQKALFHRFEVHLGGGFYF